MKYHHHVPTHCQLLTQAKLRHWRRCIGNRRAKFVRRFPPSPPLLEPVFGAGKLLPARSTTHTPFPSHDQYFESNPTFTVAAITVGDSFIPGGAFYTSQAFSGQLMARLRQPLPPLPSPHPPLSIHAGCDASPTTIGIFLWRPLPATLGRLPYVVSIGQSVSTQIHPVQTDHYRPSSCPHPCPQTWSSNLTQPASRPSRSSLTQTKSTRPESVHSPKLT